MQTNEVKNADAKDNRKRILLVDDHAVVLAGLKLYLEAVSPGIEMHTASRLKDAIDLAQDCDVALHQVKMEVRTINMPVSEHG